MATVDSITTADQLFQASSSLGRCELVRGGLIMMSPAGSEHGAVAAAVGAILRDFVKPRRLGVILGAETGFRIGSDPDTVRAPDAAFVVAERIGAQLPRGFFPGPPDLAVEVVSPEDRASEVIAKVEAWLAAGARSVWVVDPKTQTVAIHHGDRRVAVLKSADVLTDEAILPGFSTVVSEFFML
jgi:Uma2 family endonuclease